MIVWALRMSIALLQIVDGVVCFCTLTLVRPFFSAEARLLLMQWMARDACD